MDFRMVQKMPSTALSNMTSETELQGLSREAAGCLPAGFKFRGDAVDPPPLGLVSYDGENNWFYLHESTEACAEIMVRVLWEKQIGLGPSWEGAVRAFYFGSGATMPDGIAGGRDVLEAFRVAVLRALVALKP